MSIGMASYLLFAGVVFGVFGTLGYITDTWIRGDGVMRAPDALAGTSLAIALILVGIGLRRVMRDELRTRQK